ncbi:ribbon-helix-helix protein, CopG family [Candidatus Micrarchaeota archaeon]|nr:ribbon-helix-helix protein, CopG family [Candidatus Micrarchaeota archaeon]MBD3417824.1 ribbon-helix-helix protein, CopG family [Candidatus Micrarchaeota archaeon]
MEIISVSMDKDQLEELNKIQQKLGFRSRSRLFRATIDSMLNEYNMLESRRGHTDAVFTVTHASHGTDSLGRLLEEFEDVITTEVHQHHNNICLRVLISCGDAKRIKELFSHLKRNKGMRSVQVSVL